MDVTIDFMEENANNLRLGSLREFITSSFLRRHGDASLPWSTIRHENYSNPKLPTRIAQSFSLASVMVFGASILPLISFILPSTSFIIHKFSREVISSPECQESTLQLEIIIFHLKMNKFPLYQGLQERGRSISGGVGRVGKLDQLSIPDLEKILSFYEPHFDSFLFSLAELEDSQDGGLNAMWKDVCALESEINQELNKDVP